jgi:hypothetical protein
MSLVYVVMMVLNSLFGGSVKTGHAYHLTSTQYQSFQAGVSSYDVSTSSSGNGPATFSDGNGNIVVVITDQNEF